MGWFVASFITGVAALVFAYLMAFSGFGWTKSPISQMGEEKTGKRRM